MIITKTTVKIKSQRGIVLKIKAKYVIFARKNTILLDMVSIMYNGAEAISGAIKANMEKRICKYITGDITMVDNMLKWFVVPKTYKARGAVINVAATPVIREDFIIP